MMTFVMTSNNYVSKKFNIGKGRGRIRQSRVIMNNNNKINNLLIINNLLFLLLVIMLLLLLFARLINRQVEMFRGFGRRIQ